MRDSKEEDSVWFEVIFLPVAENVPTTAAMGTPSGLSKIPKWCSTTTKGMSSLVVEW